MVEQATLNRSVEGSNPPRSIFFNFSPSLAENFFSANRSGSEIENMTREVRRGIGKNGVLGIRNPRRTNIFVRRRAGARSNPAVRVARIENYEVPESPTKLYDCCDL